MVKVVQESEVASIHVPILLANGQFLYSVELGFFSTTTLTSIKKSSQSYTRFHALPNNSDLFVGETESELHWIETGDNTVKTIHTAVFDSETTEIIGTNLKNELLSVVESDGNAKVIATDYRSGESRTVFELGYDEFLFGANSSPIELLRVCQSGSSTFDSLRCPVTGELLFEQKGMVHASLPLKVVAYETLYGFGDCDDLGSNARFFTPKDSVVSDWDLVAPPRSVIFKTFDGTILGAEHFNSGSILKLGMNDEYIALSSLFESAKNRKTVIVDLMDGNRKHVSNRVAHWHWTDGYALELADCAFFLSKRFEDLLSIDLKRAYTRVQLSNDGKVILFTDPLGTTEGIAHLVRLQY